METPQRNSSSSSSQGRNPTVSSSPPPSISRLWRPAAQRNLRNQWSKLASCRSEWVTSSSAGRSHATSLVNAHLSRKYMPSMELGVVSDMPAIREKASSKLSKQQELHRTKLLSSYKILLGITAQMVAISKSLRCYSNTANSSSSIVQFSTNSSMDNDDRGDGGEIPVFLFWSVSFFEQLADELVQMFISELMIKRLIVVELLSSVSSEAPKGEEVWCWSNELYPGEFEQLRLCNLYPSDETDQQPIRPRLIELKSTFTNSKIQYEGQPNNLETLQVYLTTWLCEVNMDCNRIDDIFAIVGEEMHVNLL
ncbi:unnamed protein product [Linum tenue]|uniref:Uncharacterized protein n=1 Tax=Linum tenue TaxID=586396 RepID=A0AAV0PFP2_9ROSI|nr:unnamed protein product [Linum tenue]